MKKAILVLGFTLGLASCDSARNYPAPKSETELNSALTVGMSKADVYTKFGNPTYEGKRSGMDEAHFLFKMPDISGEYIGGVQVFIERETVKSWEPIWATQTISH